MSEASFRKRVVHGAMWGGVQNGVIQLLNFLKVVILARLIAPAEFGVYAVAMLALAFIEAFSTTGFEDALVQHKDEVDDLLHTAWTIQVLRGVAIFVLLLLLSSPIATFMGSSHASTIITILGASPFVRATSSLGVIKRIRNIQFRMPFVLSVAEVAGAFAASMLLTVVLSGSLALAWGVLFGLAVRSFTSYLLAPWRPKFECRRVAAKKLASYGVWISLNRMAFVILLRLDSFVVAKLLGAAELGVYQMGARISDIGSKSISSSLASVAFASLSRLQNDPKRMSRALAEGVGFIAFLSLPLAAFISAASTDLIAVLLGAKWLAVGGVLALLVWSSSLRAIASTAGWAFKAAGRPSLDLQMSVLRAVVLLLTIWPLVQKFGMVGAAWSMVMSSIALLPMFLFGLNAITPRLGVEGAKAILGPALIAVLVYVVAKPMNGIGVSPLPRLVLASIAFGVVCCTGGFAMYFLARSGPLMVFSKYLAERKA